MSETNQSNPSAPENNLTQPPTMTQKPIRVVPHLNKIRTSPHLSLLTDFLLRKSINNYFRMKRYQEKHWKNKQELKKSVRIELRKKKLNVQVMRVRNFIFNLGLSPGVMNGMHVFFELCANGILIDRSVTFVEALYQMMPGFDPEIGKLAQRIWQDNYEYGSWLILPHGCKLQIMPQVNKDE
ncbi:hypothetical protein Tco_0948147 [Tanacetum coccineum]